MMFGLLGDIGFQPIHAKVADGKRSIPALPMKFCERNSLRLDPLGSRAFDHHDDLRKRMIFAPHKQNMGAVAPRVYNHGRRIEIP